MSASTDCVKVAVRVRPFVPNELNRGCLQILEKTSPNEPQLKVTGATHSKIPDCFAFNNVFMPEDQNECIYENSVKPIIDNLLGGYNVTILAYGQTGSGKTFTMGTVFEGDWTSPKVGIIPRALRDMFLKINDLSNVTTTVTCSFVELYQENLYDLLSGKSKDQSACEIREDSSKGIIINGLTELPVADATEAAKYLMSGGENRSVGATAMNDVSSRSHAIFTVNLKIVDADDCSIKAKFHLVDLAGSERSKKTKATGTRFKEGVKINQGLLALGNVISALGGGSGSSVGYISYRDSKLTRLLQDSLGGNSVTLMIACCSPADYNIEETLSTLRYADRAKKIKNKPVKNQDSHEAELTRLRDIIQELRTKACTLARESAPNEDGRCGEACKKLMMAKDAENASLQLNLSNFLTLLNTLNSQHLIEETFSNELIEKFEILRDLLNNTCPAEFLVPETEIFEEIRDQTKVIDELINSYKKQLTDGSPNEDDFKFEDNSVTDDAVTNQKRLEYTTTQMQALIKIQGLERDMKIKQELLNRKYINTPFLNDETDKTMLEYQSTIKNLENELDELRTAASNSTIRKDHNATKVNMDRKHKVEKLEKDLTEMRKKCCNLEKTKKLAEQDRKRIEDLKKEIHEMKTVRVQLIRNQRSESDRFKKWISTRDKEINTLKEKSKKAANEMKRMERMHEKQQTVLKRKVEEAKAVNKRLQDAMDRSKKVQAMRQSTKPAVEKQDVIQTYIDHELDILMSTIDAKIAMQSLMNDRGILTERLMNLKSTVNKEMEMVEEIKQLEEDLEMRNSQITDIRQKIMQTDLDAKMKSIPENFTSLREQKIAMSYIIRALLDSREDFTLTKTKAEDLKIAFEVSEDRVQQLNDEMRQEKQNFEATKSAMENDFETKLAFWCGLNTTGLPPNEEENIKSPVYVSMSNQLCAVLDKNVELQEKIKDLELQLEKAFAGKKRSRARLDSEHNETYTKRLAGLSESDSDEVNFNDSFADPDWVKTPAQKRKQLSRPTQSLLKDSMTKMLVNISETSDTSGTKRSSNGSTKCTCKGSCGTRKCPCKKFSNFCFDSCKCSDACVNKPDATEDSEDESPERKIEKENADVDSSPERKDAKVDLANVTTPYYPYQAKKRKPLLQI